jgi:histone H3/H4
MFLNSLFSQGYSGSFLSGFIKMKPNFERSAVSKVKNKMAKLDKFADSQVEKLIRNAGAFRVSGAAITRFNDILTQKCLTTARYAVEIARHGGRKTVKASDVKLASER